MAHHAGNHQTQEVTRMGHRGPILPLSWGSQVLALYVDGTDVGEGLYCKGMALLLLSQDTKNLMEYRTGLLNLLSIDTSEPDGALLRRAVLGTVG